MKFLAAFVVVFFLLQVSLVYSACPKRTKGFGNRCYRFQQQRKSWSEANIECKLLGGQLASIDGLPLNTFLFTTYRKWKSINIWIGLKKCILNWCYVDGKISNFARWNAGEPNNVGGNENCVEMWDNGRWNDAPCDQARPFICEIPALDDDECMLGTNKCHREAICINTIGSYTCKCKEGFTGNGTVCKDINECQSGANKCNAIATCTNIFGSYICTCPTGYFGNGKNCTKEDTS